MHFAEIDTGDYRIYAGAIERPRQFGYVAAVVVVRMDHALSVHKREAFRDENLAGGYGWATPAEAEEPVRIILRTVSPLSGLSL